MNFLPTIPPQWNTLIGIVGTILTIIVSFLSIKGAIKKSNEENQAKSDKRTKEIAEKLFEKSQEESIAMQASIESLNKTIGHLGGSIDSFKVSENNHYEEHEKHLMKNDLEIQKNDDAIDDHENRIKSTEDDIDYLKKQVGGKNNE